MYLDLSDCDDMLQFPMETNAESSLVIAETELSGSEIVISSYATESRVSNDIAPINVRGAKGLARRLPANLIAGLGSTSGGKRLGPEISPVLSKKRIVESKHTASLNANADLIYSLEMEGGSLWKVREEIREVKNEIARNYSHLQSQIQSVQHTQDKILKLLEDLNSRKEEHVIALQHIVPEVRTAANKMFAVTKVQSSNISEIRATTNKLNAMMKCHLGKASTSGGDVNTL